MEVINNLSKSLTKKYGSGFSKRNVYKFQQFFKCFPEIMQTAFAQSEGGQIVPTLSAQLL